MSHLQISYKHHGYVITITKHMEYTIIYSNNPHSLTHGTHIYLYTTANCSEHGWRHIFTEYLASPKVVVAPLPKGFSWLYSSQMLNNPL